MMQNNTMMSINSKTDADKFAGTSSVQVKDDAFYRQVRSRFLLQSARYLGADLGDSKVMALCFEDITVEDLNVN